MLTRAALLISASLSCASHAQVTDRLETEFGEALQGRGLQNERMIIEIWASDETGTWTIISSRADGMACVLASGKNWLPESDDLVPAGVLL